MQCTPPVRATNMLLPHRLQHTFFLVFVVTTIVKNDCKLTNVNSHNLTWHFDRFWRDILTDFDMTLWQMLTSVNYLLIYPWHWFWWLLVLDYFMWMEEVLKRVRKLWKSFFAEEMLCLFLVLNHFDVSLFTCSYTVPPLSAPRRAMRHASMATCYMHVHREVATLRSTTMCVLL